MRISDWSSDVCSSDLNGSYRSDDSADNRQRRLGWLHQPSYEGHRQRRLGWLHQPSSEGHRQRSQSAGLMKPTQPTVLSRSSPSTLLDLHACRITRPVFRKPTALHEAVERRVRPVHRARGMPMLHRVDVDVVHVCMQVRLVPDQVFPVATLPNAALRSEEHTSELQSLMRISYAVFCLKKNTYNHK